MDLVCLYLFFLPRNAGDYSQLVPLFMDSNAADYSLFVTLFLQSNAADYIRRRFNLVSGSDETYNTLTLHHLISEIVSKKRRE